MIGTLAAVALFSVVAFPALAIRHLPALAEAPGVLRGADTTLHVFEAVRARSAEPLLSAGLL
jgi:hypothetical protein